MCPDREKIEYWRAIDNLSYEEIIIKCKNELDFTVSKSALSNHFTKHFDVITAGMDEYYARRMRLNRAGIERFKSDVEYLDEVIKAGVSKAATAKVSDALKAIELKNKLTGGKNLRVVIEGAEQYNDIVEAISILPEESKQMLLDFLDQRQREREHEEKEALGVEETNPQMISEVNI